MFGPAVIVHGLAHARLALGARRPVCLLSARGAGRYAGAGWWRAMVRAARDEFPQAVDVSDMLDCDDAPGAAMAALREGQQILILDALCPAFVAVSAAGAMLGAMVLSRRPLGLDLAEPKARAQLDAWLTHPAGDTTKPLE